MAGLMQNETMYELHRHIHPVSIQLRLDEIRGHLRAIATFCINQAALHGGNQMSYRDIVVSCHQAQKRCQKHQWQTASSGLYHAIGTLRYAGLDQIHHRLVAQIEQLIDSLAVLERR